MHTVHQILINSNLTTPIFTNKNPNHDSKYIYIYVERANKNKTDRLNRISKKKQILLRSL